MAVDRPTFSENWHRVMGLRPRLRASFDTYRQQYRGKMWHVLADRANNQFFRLDDSAYHFVALLDGRRTVADAWQISNEKQGDAAPTQGEAIRLLGQLYTSNLLHADLPPDATAMFDRYRKRVQREVGGYLMNFLFLRIPLFDPQRILAAWVHVFGWLFSWVGFALWLGVLAYGGIHLVGRGEELFHAAMPQQLLKTENLLLLYLTFAVIKAIHEFGHGFACAHFGRKSGTGGEVHTIGIMLLVFMPVPYVDASSSWAFRNKWRRAIVGAAGMYVELAVAAIAAVVWANTSPQDLAHAIAFNTIFIASISTLLFNGNPLLRFDGYYILSDVLEIANLSNRAKQYAYYLTRKYAFGVRNAIDPSYGVGERFWLMTYYIASTIYRVLICLGIALYLLFGLPEPIFPIACILVLLTLVTWIAMPTGKYLKYLFTTPELERTRPRAMAISAVVVTAVITPLVAWPVPERTTAEGVVEPTRLALVHMGADGFVAATLPSGRMVTAGADVLVDAENAELLSRRHELEAERTGVMLRIKKAENERSGELAQALEERLDAVDQSLQRVDDELRALALHAPFDGVWVSPDAERLTGTFIPRGQQVGMVADPNELIIRVAADQSLGPRIIDEIGTGPDAIVELRIKGRADVTLTGYIDEVRRFGQQKLPSQALGYHAGGSMAIDPNDRQADRAVEPFFEVHIRPFTDAPAEGGDDGASTTSPATLLIGQRVVARFTLPDRPLAMQWWTDLLRLFQRRTPIGGPPI